MSRRENLTGDEGQVKPILAYNILFIAAHHVHYRVCNGQRSLSYLDRGGKPLRGSATPSTPCLLQRTQHGRRPAQIVQACAAREYRKWRPCAPRARCRACSRCCGRRWRGRRKAVKGHERNKHGPMPVNQAPSRPCTLKERCLELMHVSFVHDTCEEERRGENHRPNLFK